LAKIFPVKEIPENARHLNDMPDSQANELKSAVQDYPKNKEWATKTKRKPPADLDQRFSDAHEAVFSEMECLTCAHCCKTTSPIVTERDIDRLSKALRQKPSTVIDKYLRHDGESYIMNAAPCPFLGADLYCSVYEHRPSACRDYPHTNRRRMVQIIDLSLNNTFVCPAVARIFSMLRGL
jgi:Fe-S-cluster containining protein